MQSTTKEQEMKSTDEILNDAMEAAIHAAALSIQTDMGVKTGDVAGQFFSGADQHEAVIAFRKYLALYISYEVRDAREAIEDEEERSAREYLRNETVFRVQTDRRVGPTPRVYYCEAANAEDAASGVPAQANLLSVRRATEDDIEEFMQS